MIPTAEEFWSEVISSEDEFSMLTALRKSGMAKHVFEAMRRFTKLHVEEALKTASEKVNEGIDYQSPDLWVEESIILESYPLENIK